MERFTLFVLLPSKDICSLRRLPSGVTAADVRDRLEMAAGLPGQTYKLTTNKGQVLHEDYEFVVGQNVWDGYIVRVQIHARWLLIYEAVSSGDVQWLLSDETLQIKLDALIEPVDAQVADMVEERGTVALYLATWKGSIKMCQELLALGVNPNGRTPFRRTALFVAVAKDNDRVLELLLTQGARAVLKDCHGHTALDVARRTFSRKCVNVLRSFQLRGAPKVATDGRSSPTFSTSVQRSRPSTSTYRPQTGQINRTGTGKVIEKETKQLNMLRGESDDNRFNNQSLRTLSCPENDTNLNIPARSSLPCQLRVALLDSLGRPTTTVSWDVPILLGSELLTVRPAFREGKLPLRSFAEPSSRAETEPVTPSTSAVPWCRPDSGAPRSVEYAQDSAVNIDGRSVQSAPNVSTEGATDKDSNKRAKTTGSSRRPLQRPSNNRKHPQESKSLRTAKRQIQLAERQKRSQSVASNQSLTFDQWLHRKRMEESECSDDSDDDSSDGDEEINEKAFQDWLKKVEERPKNSSIYSRVDTPRARSGRGLVQIVSLNGGNLSDVADTSSYLRAYQEWKRQRRGARPDVSNVADASEAKKVLAEKGRELLARAITYDEWMNITAERQEMLQLIKSPSQMKSNEVNMNRFSQGAQRNLTFQQWRHKQDERERWQKTQSMSRRNETKTRPVSVNPNK
ncbi:hypothetical protein Btru_011818 [Bulinus truncatus]|nr:hypothetical protein Btru_011818 [Bulinus truncatus]